MKRCQAEAEDLSLAIASLAVENEPDAVPRNRAQRLAMTSVVAPALRRFADVTAKRRVTVEAEDGTVAGYTTLLEVQKSLVAANALEIQVQPDDRPKQVPCAACGMPKQLSARDRGKPICDRCRGVADHCAGFDGQPCSKVPPRGAFSPWMADHCAGFDGQPCSKVPPRGAFSPWMAESRGGKPWRCQQCAGLQRAADPAYRAAYMEGRRKLAADPSWRAKVTQSNQELAKDPEHRKRLTEAMRKRANDPVWRESLRAMTSSSEWREKQLAARRKRGRDGSGA